MRSKKKSRQDLGDVRLGDLSTFLNVQRMGSLSAAARELRVTPSQVTKAIHRLETRFGVQLLARSSRGVTLTNAAVRSVPEVEELLRRLQSAWSRQDHEAQLTIAATAYMNLAVVPRLVGHSPSLRVRALVLAPTFVRASASQNVFDAALVLGPLQMPRDWSVDELGPVPMHLFGSKALAESLGSRPLSENRVRELRFVAPVFFYNDQFVPVEDGCPIPTRERLRGHETVSVDLGLELAATTEQVAFVPDFLAKQHVAQGRLVRLQVEGWNVRTPVSLACHVDRVSSPLRKLLAQIASGAISS